MGTEEHGTFSADAVIVTVSLGVLKAEVIQFTPPLPLEKLQLIEDVGTLAHFIQHVSMKNMVKNIQLLVVSDNTGGTLCWEYSY